MAELYLCRYYMCFLLIFDNWRKYTDLCCLLVRYSNVFQNNIEQDQGASLQETVWTVKRCINGGILSLLLVVVGCSGLHWATFGCTGLYWALLVCIGLHLAVLDSTWLFWNAVHCIGMYWTALGRTGLYSAELGCCVLKPAVLT